MTWDDSPVDLNGVSWEFHNPTYSANSAYDLYTPAASVEKGQPGMQAVSSYKVPPASVVASRVTKTSVSSTSTVLSNPHVIPQSLQAGDAEDRVPELEFDDDMNLATARKASVSQNSMGSNGTVRDVRTRPRRESFA